MIPCALRAAAGAAGKAGVKFGDDAADTPDGDADLLMKDSKEAAMALKVQEALKREADESSGDSGEDILVAPPPKTSLAAGKFRLTSVGCKLFAVPHCWTS